MISALFIYKKGEILEGKEGGEGVGRRQRHTNTQLTSDDDVFETSGNGAVAVMIENSFIARVQPQHPRRISHHGLIRLLRVVPIPGLQLVSCDAQLPPGTDRHNVAVAIHDLGMSVGHQGAHGRQPPAHRVVGEGVEARRRRLGQTVAAGELGHAEPLHQELHQIAWHGCSGDDAGAELVAVEVGRELGLEEGIKHGGDAVDGRAGLLRDGLQSGRDVEDLCWIDNLPAVGDDGEEAEDEAEAVEQRRGAAQDVVGCESHPVADESRIVDQVAVFCGS